MHEALRELQAEFDHFRERARTETEGASRRGALEAVTRFLPAINNLERAIHASRTSGMPDAITQGLIQIHSQFQSALDELGVERICARGRPFDPRFHDAVATVRTAAVPHGTVVEEIEPGYMADGRVLVAAQVRVGVRAHALSA